MMNDDQSKRTRLMSHVNKCFGTMASLWALFHGSAAYAEVTASAEVSARAQASTNPYLSSGEDTGSGAFVLSLSPTIAAGDEVTSFKLTGRVVHTEFTRRYDAATNYGVTGALNQKVAPNLDMKASIGFDSVIVDSGDILTPTTVGDLIGGPAVVPGDTTLNGLQQRREFFNGDVDFRYRATGRDLIDFGGSFGIVRFPSGTLVRDYDSIGYRAGYGRKISDALTVGFSGSASQTDYRQQVIGDSRSYALQGTVSARFGSRWTMQASAGPSFASIKTAVGRVRQTSFGGSLNMCNGDAIARTCVFASRSYQPSALGGVRPLTNWGTSHSRRLDERSDLQASASFGRAQLGLVGLARSNGFARADLTYNRKFSPTIKGYASVGYADSFRDVINRRANAQFNLGVTYLFGRRA
jgi:hypothetical protein